MSFLIKFIEAYICLEVVNLSDNTHKGWNFRFLNQILDSMAEGVFTLDKRGRVISWNKAMEKITGYSSEEAVGKSCNILCFDHCFGQVCPNDINQCGILKHEKSEVKECLLLHKEGYDVPVIKQAKVVKDGYGEVIGIVETVTDLTELEKARKKAEEAAKRLGEVFQLDNIIGKSHAMQEVFSAVKASASSKATVLIQGDSGTGKEMIANSIHYNSPRSNQPFVAVNCSALPESLLESELFGHVKGAFTGALRDRKGRFEEANGGTIFLDEIGEFSPYMQVKLLRVLQEREIERIGESKKRKIDIRIIAATRQCLQELVEKRTFREDLYYRLKVFPIIVPPLRKRKEDLPLLVNHFIAKQNKVTGKNVQRIDSPAMRLIMDYSWPGNVRELENAIEHAFVLCSGPTIHISDLPLELRQLQYHNIGMHDGQLSSFDTREKNKLDRESLIQILNENNWNKAEVARKVGLSRTAIWKYMKKWDIPLQRTTS